MKKPILTIATFLCVVNLYGQNTAWPAAGSADNVGIGTTQPDVKLQVKSLNSGDGTSVMHWIAASMGAQAGNRVVVGNLYGIPTIGGHNNELSAWSNFSINPDGGNIGIGTSIPDTKLAVKGIIHSQAVKVDMIGWSDHVFKPTYQLRSLNAVKMFIDKNQHLPEVPSEQEVKKNGIDLGEMNNILLKKVEELTLYLIKQDQRMKKLEAKIKALGKVTVKNNKIL